MKSLSRTLFGGHFALLALLCAPLAARSAEVTATKTEDTIEFRIGKELVTTYHFGPKVAKPYFWPLLAPGGVPVTRDWPMKKGAPKETVDHVHQKSAWFCHGDLIPEGLELKVKSADKHVTGVDFWSEAPGHGKMKCVKVGNPESSGNSVRIDTFNEWQTADGVKILDEQRTIELIDLGESRLLVLYIELEASTYPITFGDTKEGSMGVRIRDEMRVKGGNGAIFNSFGKKNEKEIWGREADWNDYVGKVGDSEVGLAIFDDPRNPHQAVWHTREYGLMAANPFGRTKSGFPDRKTQSDLVKLPKGGHMKLRYGLLIHSGNTEYAKVAEHYKKFTGK
ncbi:MAG: PmoA family protein [Zavarzinella sp.]